MMVGICNLFKIRTVSKLLSVILLKIIVYKVFKHTGKNKDTSEATCVVLFLMKQVS